MSLYFDIQEVFESYIMYFECMCSQTAPVMFDSKDFTLDIVRNLDPFF